MPPFADLMAAVATTFSGLGLMPIFAAIAAVSGVVVLTRGLTRALWRG